MIIRNTVQFTKLMLHTSMIYAYIKMDLHTHVLSHSPVYSRTDPKQPLKRVLEIKTSYTQVRSVSIVLG
jgi:hypothetical protein